MVLVYPQGSENLSPVDRERSGPK